MESEQGEQSLWLRQLATGQTLRLIPNRRVGYWGHAFTRDGNSIVFGLKSGEDLDGAFYSIATLGGTPRRLVAGIDSSPTFSPDGSRMAWVRAGYPSPEESALMVAKLDGAEARVLAAVKLPEKLAPIFWTGPSWSPDGRRIACSVAGVDRGEMGTWAKLIAVSAADGRIETLADPPWSVAAQVAWLPDSRGLMAVAQGEDGGTTQVWLVPLPQGAPRRVTSDLLEYRIVSLTADGRSLVTVAADALASIWLLARDGKSPARRLTSAKFDGFFGLDLAPDGRVVYASWEGGAEGLWITSADAAQRDPLPAGDGMLREPRVTRSGEVFYLARTRSGLEIRRLPLDGSAPRIVVSGVHDGGLTVSPDERFVVFTAVRQGEVRLFRVSASGGAAEPLTDYPAEGPAFSPDGKRIACYYLDRASNRFKIGILPADGGPPARSLETAPPAAGSRLRFGDDGVYVNTMPTDRANVWVLPLDGATPRRVTDFQDLFVFGFAIAPDGKSLAFSRGPRTRDALLLRGFL